MIDVLVARIRQGRRTVPFPVENPPLPQRFRGLPVMDRAACDTGCARCSDVCPTGAIDLTSDAVDIDLGRCLFCPECVRACPNGALSFSREHRLAATSRDGLHADGSGAVPAIEQLAEHKGPPQSQTSKPASPY